MIRQPWETMAEVRLKSKRFRGQNAQELAWREFEQFARSVSEAAAALWFMENPDLHTSLWAFQESTGAESVHAQADAAAALLVLSVTPREQDPLRPEIEEIKRTFERVWITLYTAEQTPPSEQLPKAILPLIAWGSRLHDEDEVEIAPLGDRPVRLSTEQFRRLYYRLLSEVRPSADRASPEANAGRPDEPVRPPQEERSLDEVLDEIAAQIPEEVLAKIPTDLSHNLDHYLYGTPRK